jgi:hypothetical protein
MSRHEDRQRLAGEFGATDIVEERGDAGVEPIKELKVFDLELPLEDAADRYAALDGRRSVRALLHP